MIERTEEDKARFAADMDRIRANKSPQPNEWWKEKTSGRDVYVKSVEPLPVDLVLFQWNDTGKHSESRISRFRQRFEFEKSE